VTQAAVTRLLDRSIRESEAIDTESLCIIGGEKVWMIKCEVRIVDYGGGNAIDAALFAAMGALRAFRKPEVSAVSSADLGSNIRELIIHSADEREPLPLALHHTPLCVTFGVFRSIKAVETTSAATASTATGTSMEDGSGLGSSSSNQVRLCAVLFCAVLCRAVPCFAIL
jgi:exosome complex component RRP45